MDSATPRIKVLLVDDHALFRQGVRSLLERSGEYEIVGEYPDGQTALAHLESVHPDILLVDISMPGLNGLELTKRLVTKGFASPILVLTAYDDSAYIREVMASGARGYLLKQSAAEDLHHAIRKVLRGEVYLGPGVAEKVMKTTPSKRGSSAAKNRAEITPREREVLIEVARGLSNKEIAARLEISIKTVEVHKSNFMSKLEVQSRAEVFRFAMERGWL